MRLNVVFIGEENVVLTKKKYLFLLSLCLIIAMIGLYGLWCDMVPKRKAQEFYEEMNLKREQLLTEEETRSQVEKKEYDSSSEVLTEKNQWLMEMVSLYPNIVGWIRGEGTKIDYPIMQTDNNSYYLNHLPDGADNKLGSIFLDKDVNSDFSSPVTIIYGHMMQNGEMFGELNNYREQDFFENHSNLELYTMEGKRSLVLLAAYLVDGSSDSYPKEFDTSDTFYSYIKDIKSKSFFYSEATPVLGDKLVILSTCAYDFDEARLAVVGYISP